MNCAKGSLEYGTMSYGPSIVETVTSFTPMEETPHLRVPRCPQIWNCRLDCDPWHQCHFFYPMPYVIGLQGSYANPTCSLLAVVECRSPKREHLQQVPLGVGSPKGDENGGRVTGFQRSCLCLDTTAQCMVLKNFSSSCTAIIASSKQWQAGILKKELKQLDGLLTKGTGNEVEAGEEWTGVGLLFVNIDLIILHRFGSKGQDQMVIEGDENSNFFHGILT
ncbi:hypothetical protein Tco_1186508 [Tanacetum coccineum]